MLQEGIEITGSGLKKGVCPAVFNNDERFLYGCNSMFLLLFYRRLNS
jgi:hypothetical protein